MTIIHHLDQISGSPIVAVALAGWKELVDAGYGSDQEVLLGWDQKAFYAALPGSQRIVGVLLYQDIEWRRSLNVVLGYVVPEFRHAGIYRKLWEALVAKGKELDRTRILGTTHINNKEMQAVMGHFRRRAAWIVYEHDL